MEKHFRLLMVALLLHVVVIAQRQLNGIVRDASTSEGLPSATVKIQGRNILATTNAEGAFTLNAPQGAFALEVSFIGYGTKTVNVGANDNDLIIALNATEAELTQVVVTALGISKEARKLGYAVTKVEGDLLNQARETNVALSLAGRVPGLNVSGANGGPGSTARLNIRGVTSFSGSSQPLIVINGVPMDNTQRGQSGEWGGADMGDGIQNINPDDIESMTVLKGSTASALYGARAANGVILITTKSGRKGAVSVEYNLNYAIDEAIDNTDKQYVYGQGSQGKRPTDVASATLTGIYGWGERMDGAPTIQFDGKTYPYSPVEDNIKEFYRRGPSVTNTVSVGGGSEGSAFRLSLSYLDNKSILRNSGIRRITSNLSANQKVTDKLSVGLTANYIEQRDKNRPQLSDAPLNANYGIAFLAPNVDQEALKPGYNAAANGAEMQYNDDIFKTNPWFVVNQYQNNVDRKRLIAAVTPRYDFTDWLFLQGRLGYDIITDDYFQITPWGTAYSAERRGGLSRSSKRQISELNADFLAGARRTLATDLDLDLNVGGSIRKRKDEEKGTNGNRFIIPYLYTPSNLQTTSFIYRFAELETHSLYYTADFTYKNFLTLGTTGRNDWFSTLPADNNSIFTPSVYTSFIFSELLDLPIISYGKLRASYAETSGEPANPYTTSQYYTLSQPINGIPRGSFSSTLPNFFLKPYRLKEFEVGTELKLFENRLGLDFAYFHRHTLNEIIAAQQSVATGFTSSFLNLGKTKNTGVEVQLTGSPVRTSDFNWTATFNFTKVKNLVEEIDGVSKFINTGTYRPLNGNIAIVKGYPISQIMAYDYLRDAKGDIVVGSNGIPLRGELKPFGSGLADIFGGLNNDFSYKGINLSFLFDYKFGNKILSATNHYYYIDGLHQATLEGRETGVVADGVMEDGSRNTINVPAYTYYPGLIRNISAINVYDGSFIKLRQVTLGYQFAGSMLGNLPFRSITLSLVGRNLATILKHTDNIDPESAFSADVRYAGTEGGALPATRTYGVNLNFAFKNK